MSGVAVTTALVTMSRIVRVGCPPSATLRTTMSRSVTMPTGRPFSTTGTAPVSSSRIMHAAFWMVSSGVTVRGLGVITSRIFMGSPLSALAGGYLALFLSKSKAPPAEPYNRFVARAAVFVGVAALVVFAVVQDRLTVAGVGQYIAAS